MQPLSTVASLSASHAVTCKCGDRPKYVASWCQAAIAGLSGSLMNHVEVYTRMFGPTMLSTASRIAGCLTSACTHVSRTCVRERWRAVRSAVSGPPMARSNAASCFRHVAAWAAVSAGLGERNPSREYRATSAAESAGGIVTPPCSRRR